MAGDVNVLDSLFCEKKALGLTAEVATGVANLSGSALAQFSMSLDRVCGGGWHWPLGVT